MFGYDGVKSGLALNKLWASVRIEIVSDDDEQFKLFVTDDPNKPLQLDVLLSPHSLLDLVWSFISNLIFADDTKSVNLSPFGQQYVTVVYSGPNPRTTFSVTMEETSKRPQCFCPIYLHSVLQKLRKYLHHICCDNLCGYIRLSMS